MPIPKGYLIWDSIYGTLKFFKFWNRGQISGCQGSVSGSGQEGDGRGHQRATCQSSSELFSVLTVASRTNRGNKTARNLIHSSTSKTKEIGIRSVGFISVNILVEMYHFM